MEHNTTEELAPLLRELADSIENGNTTVTDVQADTQFAIDSPIESELRIAYRPANSDLHPLGRLFGKSDE